MNPFTIPIPTGTIEGITDMPEDGDYDHRLVKETICSAQICTRKAAEEAALWLTDVRPPGTELNMWTFRKESGEVPCQEHPDTHRHIIVVC